MPVDRKALRERMKAAKAEHREKVKNILFPLPDLKGPGGNAFSLLGDASRLMKQAGVPETTQDEFRTEATKGDYENLLRAIQEWFTVVVPDVQYVPIGDRDIVSLRGNEDDVGDWDQFDTENPQTDDAAVDEAMEDYAATAERDRKIAEVQDRINREVRQDLGLEEDDVVIVQVKKAKKP